MNMLNWNDIDTVLLDMDGTLLDLHYDNHFWLEHVPQRYAERHGLPLADAHAELKARYQRVAGTMQWYCVDYWTHELELDIARLKEEVEHLIAVHPHVEKFLGSLQLEGKRSVLVTNAHHKSLALKMRHTRLNHHFDAMICAHDIGIPKEHPEFWGKLQDVEIYFPEKTLLVDDSLPVLRSARDFGIKHLLAVRRPDTKQPEKDTGEFAAISSFADIAL
jgi:HAD superfamily hydrolase (TIGR01509 family)